MNSIVLSNITYRYPLTDFDALHNVNFCFEEGKFYGVIGPNGAGKTTLCSLVKGLIPGFFQGELTGEVQILGMRRFSRPMAISSNTVSFTPLICVKGFWKI